jgi:hypothetical protein
MLQAFPTVLKFLIPYITYEKTERKIRYYLYANVLLPIVSDVLAGLGFDASFINLTYTQ